MLNNLYTEFAIHRGRGPLEGMAQALTANRRMKDRLRRRRRG